MSVGCGMVSGRLRSKIIPLGLAEFLDLACGTNNLALDCTHLLALLQNSIICSVSMAQMRMRAGREWDSGGEGHWSTRSAPVSTIWCTKINRSPLGARMYSCYGTNVGLGACCCGPQLGKSIVRGQNPAFPGAPAGKGRAAGSGGSRGA